MRVLAREVLAWLEALLGVLPGIGGSRARRWFYSRRLRHLGSRATFGRNPLVIGHARIRIGDEFSCWRDCTIAACDGSISIGDRVSFNANVYLNAGCEGLIELGDDVLIGPNVVMRTSDHRFSSVARPIREQGHISGTIVIEGDVWLGANVVIVGGVRIGRGAVVAAGAVVTRDVEAYSVAGGVPAKLLKMRESAAGKESNLPEAPSPRV